MVHAGLRKGMRPRVQEDMVAASTHLHGELTILKASRARGVKSRSHYPEQRADWLPSRSFVSWL
jgi:hypothetical protein